MGGNINRCYSRFRSEGGRLSLLPGRTATGLHVLGLGRLLPLARSGPQEFVDKAEAGVYITDEYDDLYIVVFPGKDRDDRSMIVEVNQAEGLPHVTAFDVDSDEWDSYVTFSPISADVLLDVKAKNLIPVTRFLVNGETTC